MSKYKIELIDESTEYPIVIVFHELGHRCGYVGVKKDHPLFGYYESSEIKSDKLKQDIENAPIGKRGIMSLFTWNGKTVTPEILFDVHGSITYTGKGCYPITRSYPIWWFGFDCAHIGDATDWKSCEKYFPNGSWQRRLEIEKKFHPGYEIRSLEYVYNECELLKRQLEAVRKILLEEY